MLVKCDTTITNIVNSMSKEFPILMEKTTCFLNCKVTVNSLKVKTYLSNQTESGKIKNLQDFLDNCLQPVHSPCHFMASGNFCEGFKEIMPDISDMHLFIDVFYWEGKYFD